MKALLRPGTPRLIAVVLLVQAVEVAFFFAAVGLRAGLFALAFAAVAWILGWLNAERIARKGGA